MMNRSQVVFKAIDILGYIPQNMTHYRGIVCVKDVAFSEERSKYCMGDIYYKESAMHKCVETGKKMPIILNAHGGGFVMGDKKCRKSLSSFWANKGYFVFNVNYGLSPDAFFPGYVNDVVDALNYLEEIQKYYGVLDLDKIIIMGDSSGGYTTTFVTALAFDDKYREDLGIHEFKLKPAICAPFCGIYDIETLLNNNVLPFQIINSTASTFLGFEDVGVGKDLSAIYDYKYVDYLSPLPHINKDWCPIFLVWSNSDIICTNQGKPLFDKAVEILGEDNVDHYEANGFANNHCFHLNMTTKASKECLKAANEFFIRKLNLEDLVTEEKPADKETKAEEAVK